jgi:lipopolysaccharide biosynthesis regulator YciM
MRYQKRIKIGPGLRLNLSKSGVSLSVGPRGAHYTIGSNGRRTKSLGIPGSGISWVSRSKAGSGDDHRKVGARSAKQEKPGLFAGRYERQFYKAVELLHADKPEAALAAFCEARSLDRDAENIAEEWMIGVLAFQLGDFQEAIDALETVVASSVSLPDAMVKKYLKDDTVAIPITRNNEVITRPHSLSAALLLAECYQRIDQIEPAIHLLTELWSATGDPALTLSLCELHAETMQWDKVLDTATGIKTVDDLTLDIRIFHARAAVAKGFHDAAIEVLKEALRSKKLDADLIMEGLYLRGTLYAAGGKNKLAVRDFSQVHAHNPRYGDIEEKLAACLQVGA